MSRTAIVAGAGIAGLAVAIALSRQGWRVEVWEQAPALTEVGAGLQLSPNAMRALEFLGLSNAVENNGFEPENAEIRHFQTGVRHISLPLKATCRARFGAPFLQVHRADLLRVLSVAAAAADVEIRLGTPVTEFSEVVDGVTAIGPDTSQTVDLLIGADGIRSAIQGQLLMTPAPRFTGQVAWRALIPADRLPTATVRGNATVWAGPGHHLVTYLLRDGNLVNVVAIQERDDWRDEAWTSIGNSTELCAAFSGWHDDVQTILSAVDESYLWALFDRPPLPQWHGDRTVLVGDACHPTLPFMAQGAAMALEDAIVLARCLEGDVITAALKRFQSTRHSRTTRLQARARDNAGLFHRTQGPAGLISRAKLAAGPLLPGILKWQSVDWIYGHDPASVPLAP